MHALILGADVSCGYKLLNVSIEGGPPKMPLGKKSDENLKIC